LSIKFLKFIKINNDQGKPTYIKDIMDHFNYKKHQVVSKYLDKLEKNQLIDCHWDKRKRAIDITAKGVDFICSLACSYLSELEQMWIKKLRREGKIRASFGTIALIVLEFTQSMVLNQDDSIKNVILREFGRKKVPESSLENICERIRQIQLESSREFIENYRNKNALL
jgi:predicted transcriptional regulator